MLKRQPKKRLAVLSVHALHDTRIANHLTSLVQHGYRVSYVNWSPHGYRLPSWLTEESCLRLIHHPGASMIAGNPVKYVGMLAWFFGALLCHPPCLVHMHDFILLPLTLPIKLILRSKVVFDVHEDYSHYVGRVGRYASLYYRWFLPFVDAIVAVTPRIVPKGAKLYKVIPNYQPRHDCPYTSATSRESNIVNIVYFGSLSSEDRDVLLMIDVAERTLREAENAVFKIGGVVSGAGCEQVTRRLELLSAQYGPRFQWFGPMAREDVLRHTLTADVGLWFVKDLPNIRGASPNKIYEYLQAGVAILATAGFEVAQEIEKAGAGLLFPPGVPPSLVVNALVSLAKDRSRLEQMKSASAELGRRYSWEEVAQRYFALYEQLGVS